MTETTHLNNPQQLSDTVFTITPTSVGIQTLITDRTANRISQNAFRKTGVLAMNAIQRKKDEDGLTVLDGMTSLGGAGTTLTSGHISAATSTITSNTTEGALGPIFGVLHGFQIKDLQDEIVQGVNPSTAPEQLLTTGLAARTYQSRFRGMLFGAMLLEDGNISIDSADDSKGGVFAKEAVVLVQGTPPELRYDGSHTSPAGPPACSSTTSTRMGSAARVTGAEKSTPTRPRPPARPSS